MQPIEAKYISYNANTRNKAVGDCTKRALSLAFGLDYDDVSRELNQIKRDRGQTRYNSDSVWTKFTDRRNVRFIKDNRGINLDEFCQEHPTGTYLILTGKPARDYADHIVCVIDGNIYDSWNSGDQKVFKYALVNSAASADWDYQSTTMQDIFQDLCDYASEYCSQLQTKYSTYLANLQLRSYSVKDNTTGILRIGVQVLDEPNYRFSSYRSGVTYVHEIIAKLNIKFSKDENTSALKKKIKQKIYDWVYNVVDDLKAAKAARAFETQSQSKVFERLSPADKRFITKLPEWSWPYIYSASFDDSKWSGYKYRIGMDRLPDDPNNRGYADVVFYADSLSELRQDMNTYHDTFKEPNY